MSFASALAELKGTDIEGRYSDDPTDPGNWTGGHVGVGILKGTMCGISAASYPDLDIAHLTDADISAIYWRDFWLPLHCNELAPALASAVLKVGVNLGARDGRVIRLLQGAVATVQDGDLGEATLRAIAALPEDYVLSAFLGDVAYRYTELAGFQLDGRGWLRRTITTAIESARTTT